MRTPLVSIIVPNFNHAPFLRQRLESIFEQTFQDFELILLDDKSTDSSVQVLGNYAANPQVSHFVINEKNSGSPFKQWKKGLDLAKGKYVWIAESDDYCEKDFLSQMVSLHKEHPEIAIAYSQSHRVDHVGNITGNWLDYTDFLNSNEGNIFRKNFVMEGNFFIERFLIHRNVIPNVSAVLFKKENLDTVISNEIFSCFKYNADWFYYVKLLCNKKIAFNADSLNYFRKHERSVIFKAEGESGRLKILKMELQGRKKMIEHLRECKPSNFSKIKEREKSDINGMYSTIALTCLKNRDFIDGVAVIWNKPVLWKKVGSYFLKRFN